VSGLQAAIEFKMFKLNVYGDSALIIVSKKERDFLLKEKRFHLTWVTMPYTTNRCLVGDRNFTKAARRTEKAASNVGGKA